MSARALVVSYSDIRDDPRVSRQIDWLLGAGWTVDSLGLGPRTTEGVARHHVIADQKPWLSTRWGFLLIHVLLPRRRRFRKLITDRVPAELVHAIRSGAYDLVVFNEFEFAPWVDDPRDFTPAARRARLHLDMHEYHRPDLRRQTLGGRLTAHHYRWVRRQIGNPAFTSRSVVNAPIGELYAQELGMPVPVPIRNVPPYVDQPPSETSPGRVRLLYHGMAAWERGFREILDAMRELPDRFTMTFMLTPSAIGEGLRALIAAHPARDRIEIVPPVPMREIAERINGYDIEIIFLPPTNMNLRFALPNKLFESIQGRLGIVMGESPAMVEVVREYGDGVVVEGWGSADLLRTLEALSYEDVVRMKAASDLAARTLNAEQEGRVFLALIGPPATIPATD
ncbi:hypothetical protein [Microbacterium sp.]|uniref:hypothetical protein n=1 Tax=Microbacterium sp. TaxID=51671 RepID=UPI00092B0FED|nr:hypothetical protein [Microbacterium sp.]MBN9187972.1 hypothetical protein [Microbacterium sp.]MBN9192831.1 hypothetical protein [Microbacterium sp.]OJU68313.1 MAG: hypothetical protein BGO04_12245 [Microbacterium sp. 70-38]